MTSMRDAMLANPALAQTIHEIEERRREAAKRRALHRARAQRDAAIAALVKARKSKKRVKPLMAYVQECVAQLQRAQRAMEVAA